MKTTRVKMSSCRSGAAVAGLALLAALGCESACGPLVRLGTDAGVGDGGVDLADGGDVDGGAEEVCDPHELRGTEPENGALLRLAVLVDVSGSLQFIDPEATRRTAIRDVMSHYAYVPNVSVLTYGIGMTTYGAVDASGNPVEFIPAPNWVEPQWLGAADVVTDMQGALMALEAAIEADLSTLDESTLDRVFYEVVVLADGAPSPRCCIPDDETVGELGPLEPDCVTASLPNAEPDATYCGGFAESNVCNDMDWLDNLRETGGHDPDNGVFVLEGFAIGDGRNRTPALLDIVERTKATAEAAGIARFRLHGGHLVRDGLDPVVGQIYVLDSCTIKSIMLRLSEVGGGRYDQLDTNDDFDLRPFVTECAADDD